MKRVPFRYHLLFTILFVFLINIVDRGITTTLLPVIRKDLGLSVSAMGLAVSTFYITIILGNLIGGYLSDRFGSRLILKIITIGFSLITALTGFIHNTFQLIAVRMGLGLFESPDISASIGLMARWFPEKERGKAASIFFAATVIGSILPLLVAIPLTNYFGNWRPVFYAMLLPGIIAAVLVWRYVFNSPKDALEKGRLSQEEYHYITGGINEVSKSKINLGIVVQLLKTSVFWVGVIIYFSQVSLSVGFGLWQSTYLMDGLHMNLSQMGIIGSIPAITSIIGIVVFGWLNDRFQSIQVRWLLFISFLGTGISFFLISKVQSADEIPLLIFGLSLHGLFLTSGVVPMQTYLQKRYGGKVVSTAYGITNGIAQIGGSFLTPVLIGMLIKDTASSLNFDDVFILCIGFSIVGLTFSLLLTSVPLRPDPRSPIPQAP